MGVDWINLAQDKGKWQATLHTGSIQCGKFLCVARDLLVSQVWFCSVELLSNFAVVPAVYTCC